MHCKTHWNAGMPYLPKELFIMLTETKWKKENKQLPAFSVLVSLVSYITEDPHRLAFTWWGCCRSCLWHKPTELAHSFLFCSCVCFCLCCPFNCISFHKFSWQLSAFSTCSSGLIKYFLPYWSFQLNCIFMKVSLSPDIVLCGFLGFKHQRTLHEHYCCCFSYRRLLYSKASSV